MSNALDTYTLEHFLDYVSDGTGMVQIDEPQGFDSANFVVKQDKGRYGRDVSFSGEKADYVFINKNNLFPSPFPLLNEYDKIYGYESEVKYILRENGIDYVIGELDFQNKTNDLVREFKCTVIQDTEQAQLKRRIKTKVDLFSDEDLNGDPITPVATSNILLKAKPIVQESEWGYTDYWTSTGSTNPSLVNRFLQNPFISLIASGIENTINFIDRALDSGSSNLYDNIFNTGWIDAQEDIIDLTFSLEGITLSFFIGTGDNFDDDWKLPSLAPYIEFNQYILPTGLSSYSQSDVYPSGNPQTQGEFLDFTVEFLGNESISRFDGFSGNADRYDVTITDVVINSEAGLPRGFRLSSLFKIERGQTIVEWNSGSVKGSGTSTAIDSITEGVRLIDAMRQDVKSINPSFTINAPRFDVGGEHYDNFLFNGNLIRGRRDEDGNNVPFVITWQDITKALPEMNADYEIKGTDIFAGHESDFYPNTEIGVFEQAPDSTFQMTYNERFTINEFNKKYKKFNQDKDDDNTKDGVHTECEFNVPNTRVENTKPITVDFIRDPFMLETTRKKAVQVKGTTSLSQDDAIFIFDVVPLSPSSTSGFTAPLTHFVNDEGNLQLLNNGTFNWNLLGFGIGEVFDLINTDNVGSYTVLELEQNIITLSGGAPSSIGLRLTEVLYPLTNVQFVIRTNEGFDLIENILAPNDFGNLRYTIKRNIINYWGSYLKTATKFNPDIIRNTYFKNGGNLVTQFMGGAILEEKANIEQSELSEAILTPNTITTKILCNFTTYRELQEKIKAEIISGTRGGFIRIFDNDLRVRKGFIQTSDYSLPTGELELTLEEKFESEFTNIRKEFSTYIIDEVGYPQDLVPVLVYQTDGDYIQLFDSITRPLTNKIRYDFMTVNDVVFDNLTDLAIAISEL